MNAATKKARLAVVSPFLDKSHGTERIAVEWIAQIVGDFDIHVYSQRVEDLDLSTITWHRIPKLPGPHIFNFIWWFAANHLWRAWDRRVKNLGYDLVYSPGVNCFGADAVSVHIVFAEFLRRVRPELGIRAKSAAHVAAVAASQALLSARDCAGKARFSTTGDTIDPHLQTERRRARAILRPPRPPPVDRDRTGSPHVQS